MHGNVWEWCADHLHDNYEGAPKDGSAWVESNNNDNHDPVLRGGSWNNAPVFCRSAYRSSNKPNYVKQEVGFRVACSGFSKH